jgi:hypothetical protein
MRDPILVDVDEMEQELESLRSRLADSFSGEEMDAIREQLEARAETAEKAHLLLQGRVQAAEQAREDMEFKVRLQLAKVRDAEAACERAAAEMREVAAQLAKILGEEAAAATKPPPAPRLASGTPGQGVNRYARRRMFA